RVEPDVGNGCLHSQNSDGDQAGGHGVEGREDDEDAVVDRIEAPAGVEGGGPGQQEQCELEETEIASASTVDREREGSQLVADPCRDEDGEGDDGGGHSGIGQGGRGSVVMCGSRGGYAHDLMIA